MLSNIEELLERSIFHSIREVAVAEGYLPDIKNYPVNDNDTTIAKNAKLDYENALIVIANTKGFAIDIFGSGNNEDKGFKKTPRIVVNSQSFQPGVLGGDTTPVYTLVNGTYVKNKNVSITSDFYFNIYIVASNIEQLRVLNAIIARALPRRGYIKSHIDITIQPDGNIFIRFISSGDSPDLPEGILEKFFNYEASDIFEALPETIDTTVNGNPFDIKPIIDINLTTIFN